MIHSCCFFGFVETLGMLNFARWDGQFWECPATGFFDGVNYEEGTNTMHTNAPPSRLTVVCPAGRPAMTVTRTEKSIVTALAGTSTCPTFPRLRRLMPGEH